MNFLEKLKDKRGVEFITDTNSNDNYDYEVESMTTNDGYEIWVVKERYEGVDINDNVFYYDGGAIEKVQELIIEEENITIKFWDKEIYDNIDWEDVEDELADELWEFSDEDEISEAWAELYLESIIETEREQGSGEADEVMRNESFHAYTDNLHKEGKISEEFYNNVCLSDEYLETLSV